jgi:hypothetical protein
MLQIPPSVFPVIKQLSTNLTQAYIYIYMCVCVALLLQKNTEERECVAAAGVSFNYEMHVSLLNEAIHQTSAVVPQDFQAYSLQAVCMAAGQ